MYRLISLVSRIIFCGIFFSTPTFALLETEEEGAPAASKSLTIQEEHQICSVWLKELKGLQGKNPVMDMIYGYYGEDSKLKALEANVIKWLKNKVKLGEDKHSIFIQNLTSAANLVNAQMMGSIGPFGSYTSCTNSPMFNAVQYIFPILRACDSETFTSVHRASVVASYPATLERVVLSSKNLIRTVVHEVTNRSLQIRGLVLAMQVMEGELAKGASNKGELINNITRDLRKNGPPAVFKGAPNPMEILRNYIKFEEGSLTVARSLERLNDVHNTLSMWAFSKDAEKLGDYLGRINILHNEMECCRTDNKGFEQFFVRSLDRVRYLFQMVDGLEAEGTVIPQTFAGPALSSEFDLYNKNLSFLTAELSNCVAMELAPKANFGLIPKLWEVVNESPDTYIGHLHITHPSIFERVAYPPSESQKKRARQKGKNPGASGSAAGKAGETSKADEVVRLQAELGLLLDELQIRKQELEAAQKAAKGISQQNVQGMKEDHQKQVQDLEGQITELKSQLENSQNTVKKLENRITQNQRLDQEQQAETQVLREVSDMIQVKEGIIASLNQQVAQLEEELQKVQEALKVQKQQAQKEKAEVEAESAQRQGKLIVASATRNQAQKDLEQANNQKRTLEQEKASLLRVLQAQQAHYEGTLTTMHQGYETQMTHLQESSQQKFVQLQSELQHLQNERDQLQAEIAQLKRQLARVAQVPPSQGPAQYVPNAQVSLGQLRPPVSHIPLMPLDPVMTLGGHSQNRPLPANPLEAQLIIDAQAAQLAELRQQLAAREEAKSKEDQERKDRRASAQKIYDNMRAELELLKNENKAFKEKAVSKGNLPQSITVEDENGNLKRIPLNNEGYAYTLGGPMYPSKITVQDADGNQYEVLKTTHGDQVYYELSFGKHPQKIYVSTGQVDWEGAFAGTDGEGVATYTLPENYAYYPETVWLQNLDGSGVWLEIHYVSEDPTVPPVYVLPQPGYPMGATTMMQNPGMVPSSLMGQPSMSSVPGMPGMPGIPVSMGSGMFPTHMMMTGVPTTFTTTPGPIPGVPPHPAMPPMPGEEGSQSESQ